jgi:iron complex transport system substrate-binding protein
MINAGAAVVAIALAVVAGSWGASPRAVPTPPPATAPLDLVDLPGGERGLRDATGEIVALRPYRRILAASTIADRLVLELVEPDRVVGVTAYGRSQSPWAYQQADKPAIAGADDLEAALALKPDLVLLNSFGETAKVTRLRERGVAVFDLGEMRGAATLVRNIHVVAHLAGHPERGARFAATWRRRFDAVDATLGDRPRRRAMYVSTYGGKMFGGARNTSYGDVLVAAGLIDAATAAGYDGFPQLTSEQLLQLDPDVIVTKPDMGAELCRIAGLDRLKACRSPAGFVEVDGALLDDPGVFMLDAAELVFAAAYPEPR